MMKVWENLKSVMQRCKVTLLSEDIADPSAVFRCTAAGSILLFLLVFNHVVYAPELNRALNLFPAGTVTVGQSDTSPMV